MSLPSRTLGGGGFGSRFGERERARSARHAPDGLKMNCALMKRTELKMLWKLVKAGEDRPLSAADLALLLRIRFALQEYEVKIGQGPPPWRGHLKMNSALMERTELKTRWDW